MSFIVEPQYSQLKRRLSARTHDEIKRKAAWEGITLSAVVKEYPTILPKRFQQLVPNCFAPTMAEALRLRIIGLKHELRSAERQLARLDKGHP